MLDGCVCSPLSHIMPRFAKTLSILSSLGNLSVSFSV